MDDYEKVADWILEECDDPQEEVVYYFLENYDLRQVEIESVIDVDGRTEITFKLINTDEGGNPGITC
jgi:hypothetical protein